MSDEKTLREELAALLDEQFENWQWDSLAHGMSAGRYVAPMVIDRWLAQVKAEAWDEGARWSAVEAGAVDEKTSHFWLAPGDNPYREVE